MKKQNKKLFISEQLCDYVTFNFIPFETETLIKKLTFDFIEHQ